ncbi:MAG: hypothetical protein A3E84_01380 [Gammaproteobacteria bacterium RIFCSPHIGHO2_12_FULL_42_13]|nr:MAG: hypothetical protein A3E84_01380 [Gammaproteobacteria bacterium RIFCSPHIGHO2_12_FULL_42_13]
MLYAIGIYTNGKRVAQAQKDKGLFSGNQLGSFEKHTLTSLPSEMVENRAYYFPMKDEHHYVINYLQDNILIAIVSKTELEIKELTYLRTNIRTIYLRPNLNATLDDVIVNPLGYINRDILITRLKEQAAEVKTIMLDNIEKVLQRGEQLEVLLDKTDRLRLDAITFKGNAKKLNRCRC